MNSNVVLSFDGSLKFKKDLWGGYLPARPGVGADRSNQATRFARAASAAGQIIRGAILIRPIPSFTSE